MAMLMTINAMKCVMGTDLAVPMATPTDKAAIDSRYFDTSSYGNNIHHGLFGEKTSLRCEYKRMMLSAVHFILDVSK